MNDKNLITYEILSLGKNMKLISKLHSTTNNSLQELVEIANLFGGKSFYIEDDKCINEYGEVISKEDLLHLISNEHIVSIQNLDTKEYLLKNDYDTNLEKLKLTPFLTNQHYKVYTKFTDNEHTTIESWFTSRHHAEEFISRKASKSSSTQVDYELVSE